ncbi:hypothetical protein BGZ95_003381 [Linnemannia exigua]|uniref:Uncharacterized protein n=1 Tax=Linnemannia exigua TaxID=604196 RepID=A0AAD4D4M1_9FUNG|nr:hypothetical protein BGZ95_003381 [Linnemannia exigua]
MSQPDLHRKRGLANESDEFMGIKKRNLGSEATVQGVFGFPETGADSPGSIISTEGGVPAQSSTGYFDQQPYYSGSSSAATSPHLGGGSVAFYQHQQHQQQQAGMNTSAPSTPAASLSTGSSSNGGGGPSSSLARSPGSTSIWGSLAQGSHSSPPTPSVTSIAGRTAASSMGTTAGDGSFQQRLLEEQKMLHETQLQEQQKLQLAQQWELEQMQRHQHEDQQTKARHQQHQQQQHMQFQNSPPNAVVVPVHHDHNDPATWGGYNTVPTTGGTQFTGYLGGYGKGYTPAAIGGVAALAAMSAMAASRHTPTNGHRGDGSSGMDMDF